MMNLELFKPLLISLILGSLLGFERAFAEKIDHSDEDASAGIRTYALIALLGCIAAYLDSNLAQGVLLIAFGGIIVITIVFYYISYYKHNDRGITTEISIFIAFTIGVMVQMDHLQLAVFVTIVVAIILYLKQTTDRLARRIKAEDIRAVLKFAIITFVILPVFDPGFSVALGDIEPLKELLKGTGEEINGIELINPHTVWLMVVLISAISFTGYVATKILGNRKGIGLTGLLGGLVSSTATTLEFSRRSRGNPGQFLPFSLAITLACSIMFPRVLVEVLVVNARLIPSLSITMGMMALTGGTISILLWRKAGREPAEDVPLKNPFSIIPAVQFGVLYAVIVFMVRLMGELAGDKGVYIVSILSGLTDVDAITLSMSQLSRQDPSKLGQATVAITLAAFSNTVMKAVLAVSIGSKGLRKIILAGFSIIILAGVAGLAINFFIR